MFQQSGRLSIQGRIGKHSDPGRTLRTSPPQFPQYSCGRYQWKRSCSHTLAAILQEAGYRVGLYTSPHLVDFRERIRINGQPIPEEYVIRFVEQERGFFEPLHPSFFELTTAMAFRYFADEKVDVAVIEVGLGGRLDCTNIIHPDVCIITNISFDHTQFLGDTLAKIAGEKAGIIKGGIPVVIGETTPETRPVFLEKAQTTGALIYFAEENDREDYPGIEYELKGLYQQKNARTVLTALPLLKEAGYRLDGQAVRSGFARVVELTGLMGRWQKLQESPTLICDTGHNVGGITYITEQLKQQTYRQLHIVIGMVNDKDIRGGTGPAAPGSDLLLRQSQREASIARKRTTGACRSSRSGRTLLS